jgi:hypothetical protein
LACQYQLKVVDFDCFDLPDEDPDMALRVGQRHPARYLDPDIIRGIPAFWENNMSPQERVTGQNRLRQAISSRAILQTIDDYKKRAGLPGDVSLIVVEKE